MLQCVEVCCRVLRCFSSFDIIGVLQAVADVDNGMLQCVAECCSVLQCAAVCCSVLQCVTSERMVAM